MKALSHPAVLALTWLCLIASPGHAQAPATPAPATPAPEAQAAEEAPVVGRSLAGHIETLKSETNRTSYSIGINVARNLKETYPDLNVDFFLLGVRHIYDEERVRLSEDEINAGIVRYTEAAQEAARRSANELSKYNLENAERFLDVNGKKEGVVTLPSGLQYKVLHEGTGPKCRPDGTVSVQVHATNMKGGTIESTLVGSNRGPRQVLIPQAIPAWKEALPMMPLGSKWELYVHPKLAYGERGTDKVGPNELLKYTIEITAVH